MKAHLIRKETIEAYAMANARSRTSFEEWLEKLQHADWSIPSDIKKHLVQPICWVKVQAGLFSILVVIAIVLFASMLLEQDKFIYLFVG